MNLFLQQQPRTGGADLAGVEEGGVQRVVDGGVEVGVGADDVRVLPPSSSPMRLKLPLAARMMLAPASAAGEGHQVNVGVFRQFGAHLGAAADQVEHAGRQVQLGQQL